MTWLRKMTHQEWCCPKCGPVAARFMGHEDAEPQCIQCGAKLDGVIIRTPGTTFKAGSLEAVGVPELMDVKTWAAAHAPNPVFRQEYMGQWCGTESEADYAALMKLAEEYHAQTEAYDRSVCTGPVTRHGITPATGEEMRLISRHADKARRELLDSAKALGFDRQQVMRVTWEVDRRNYNEARDRGLP